MATERRALHRAWQAAAHAFVSSNPEHILVFAPD
jgi:hypothetical protein